MALNIGIAGAGVLGRLLAWQLSAAGHRVTVFDPSDGPMARGAAGWTAAGMLSPIAELECSEARVAELGWRSLDAWQDIVPRLPQPVAFQRNGSLLLAHAADAGSADRMLAGVRARLPAGRVGPEALSAVQLQALEPALHGCAQAWWLRDEGQIHSVQAMAALAEGATQQGAVWCWNHTVRDVAAHAIDGERFDWIFDVRGTGAVPPDARAETASVAAAQSPAADGALAVRGVRGELLWLHAPGVQLHRPVRLVHPRQRVYLVPRPGDLIVVGASEIESDDRSPISVRTTLALLSAAHSVLPALAEARIVHTDTNLRPALPDNLPRIDTAPGISRINGLFRHGWLLAPALVEDALHAAGLDAKSGAPQRPMQRSRITCEVAA